MSGYTGNSAHRSAGNATAAADMAMANGVSGAGNNSLMMYMLGNKLGMFGGEDTYA